MKNTLHLQTESPTMNWEDWYVELVTLLANSMNIEKLAAKRYINIDKAKEWFDDGFTPYVCFLENFSI